MWSLRHDEPAARGPGALAGTCFGRRTVLFHPRLSHLQTVTSGHSTASCYLIYSISGVLVDLPKPPLGDQFHRQPLLSSLAFSLLFPPLLITAVPFPPITCVPKKGKSSYFRRIPHMPGMVTYHLFEFNPYNKPLRVHSRFYSSG